LVYYNHKHDFLKFLSYSTNQGTPKQLNMPLIVRFQALILCFLKSVTKSFVVFTGTFASLRHGPTRTESQMLSCSLPKSTTFSYTLIHKTQQLRKRLGFRRLREGTVSCAAMRTKSLIPCHRHAAAAAEGGGDRGMKKANRPLPVSN